MVLKREQYGYAFFIIRINEKNDLLGSEFFQNAMGVSAGRCRGACGDKPRRVDAAVEQHERAKQRSQSVLVALRPQKPQETTKTKRNRAEPKNTQPKMTRHPGIVNLSVFFDLRSWNNC
jgi:hypothetical protein